MYIYSKKDIPGPAAYAISTATKAGGRISTAKVPGYIALEQKRAASIPAPGDYLYAPKPIVSNC
jgi:hypothetical protein